EPERLLEQARPGMAAGVERVAPLRDAVLRSVFSADRGGGPLADVEVAQQLGLPALDVEAPGKLARRERQERAFLRLIREIDEGRLVLVASSARVDLPPLERLGVAGQRHHPGLTDLAVVRIDDRLVRQHEWRRVEELYRQADGVLDPAQAEGHRAF